MLDGLGDRLDDLQAACNVPVTARRLWLAAWLRCYPQYEPLIVAVDGQRGRLDGAAVLARRRRFGVTEVVAVGHGPSDEAALPARTPETADALANAVAHALTLLRSPWRLAVSQLPLGDSVAHALAGRLRFARVVPGDVSPVLHVGPDRRLRNYVSRNHHQQVRRLLNRMRRDGLQPLIDHTRDQQVIATALPEIVAVYKRRDAALRRPSQLDDPRMACFFREVVLGHAKRSEVQLTTLRFDGGLAAYVLCFIDGDTYRMWNCRFDPAWSRYGAGRVVHDAALEQALADERCRTYDWMRGAEAYKASMSNDCTYTENLLAWSDPVLQVVTDAPRRAKAVLRRHRDSSAAGAGAWAAAKRVQRLLDAVRSR